MKFYCYTVVKKTDNKDKKYDFPLMKVVSIFCAECGSLKRNTKFYKLSPYGKKHETSIIHILYVLDIKKALNNDL